MKLLMRMFLLYRRAAVLFLLAGLLVMAGLAINSFLFATSTHGIGVRTDSVAYLWGAENLAKGLGLGRLNGLGELKPMTHWPPFYPLVLSLFELAAHLLLAGNQDSPVHSMPRPAVHRALRLFLEFRREKIFLREITRGTRFVEQVGECGGGGV